MADSASCGNNSDLENFPRFLIAATKYTPRVRLRDLVFGLTAVGGYALIYGALVESKRLTLEKRTLVLPDWPQALAGYRVAVLADLHIRDKYSIDLAQQAVAMALSQVPDLVVLPGDLVAYWKEHSLEMLHEVLAPLAMMEGKAIAIPGNREYWEGDPEFMRPVLDDIGIHYLRNSSVELDGIEWVGVDSVNAGEANPWEAFASASGKKPIVALWHEPDMVEWLPSGAALMIAGHTHGGQFRLPNGWAPVYSKNGRRFPDGFFPEASTPLYVSRGIGTTGPPSRLFCPPEVSLLTLVGTISETP